VIGVADVEEPLIEARDLTKVYAYRRGTFKALDNVNLKACKGDFLIVQGPSGSGKSTLLNILGGLEKPTSGSVFFEGKDLSRASSNSLALIRRKKIGFIFQIFNLIPSLTAFENVEAALIPENISEDERKSRIMGLLESFGIADKADHFPLELCAGEQQRVAIARALVHNPRLILADEPTGELDPATSNEVAEILQKLNRDQEVTVILTTGGVFPLKSETTINLKGGMLI